MNAHRTVRASLAVAGLALFAAPAFAEIIYEGPLLPEVRYSPAPGYYSEPVTTYYYTAPVYEEAIIVDAPRNEDRAITSDVVDVLASDRRISGNIGVSTYRNTVELTGRVTNAGQAEIAARDARSVDGVMDVQNNLQARVGGNR